MEKISEPTAVCETELLDAPFMNEAHLAMLGPRETFDMSRLPTYITSQKGKNIHNIKEVLRIKAQERKKK
jgi:hypothetical protein